MALKYSKQREIIKDCLQSRCDHPTAEEVYKDVRTKFPHISLGTVYRNLTLLADMGEIRRLHLGDGVDHFDADTSRHYHFICSACGKVVDLPLAPLEGVDEAADAAFDGHVDGHVTYFYGLCPDCEKKCEAPVS